MGQWQRHSTGSMAKMADVTPKGAQDKFGPGPHSKNSSELLECHAGVAQGLLCVCVCVFSGSV